MAAFTRNRFARAAVGPRRRTSSTARPSGFRMTFTASARRLRQLRRTGLATKSPPSKNAQATTEPSECFVSAGEGTETAADALHLAASMPCWMADATLASPGCNTWSAPAPSAKPTAWTAK